MIVASWQGQRTTTIAAELSCHPQTVRERLHRFNAEGVDGLQDRLRPGRKRRISEAERSVVIALVGTSIDLDTEQLDEYAPLFIEAAAGISSRIGAAGSSPRYAARTHISLQPALPRSASAPQSACAAARPAAAPRRVTLPRPA